MPRGRNIGLATLVACATAGLVSATEEQLAALRGQRDAANKYYQLGREAFERGDLLAAEPHFNKAAELAPFLPEPHYALAQVMMRQGRTQEAQVRMAQVQRSIPTTTLPGGEMPKSGSKANGAAVTTLPSSDISVSNLAAAASAQLQAMRHVHATKIGSALVQIAAALGDAHRSILQMQGSESAQDRHNAKIHLQQYMLAENEFRAVTQRPTELSPWWQFAVSSFNTRRDYASATRAFAVADAISRAPMVLLSYYLLFHAWQHLCDWRSWEYRLRTLSQRLHASVGDRMLPERGPGNTLRWAIKGSAQQASGVGRAIDGGGDGGGANADGGATGSIAQQAGLSLDDDGAPPEGAGKDYERLVSAMEVPYLFLVSRLVDAEPLLVRRTFARQVRFAREMYLASVAGPSGEATSLSASAPAPALRGGQLTVAYLSGLPAGHVTYDLVGSMLQFHRDPRVKVYWCTAAAEPAPVKGGIGGGLKVHWPHVLELSHRSAQHQAELLREAGVGVLVDLDGFIGDEPPRKLMQARPAPVTAQWLGWAGTTADPAVGYMVTDAATTPHIHAAHYSERLVVLPRSYQLNDHAQIYGNVLHAEGGVSAAAIASHDVGGDRGDGELAALSQGFTFANFNQVMKLSPDVFDVWAGALRRTPSSRLLLLTGVTNVHVKYPGAQRNLIAETASRGLHSGRLLRGATLHKEAHLRRAAWCSLALDTLSYNSHTTGSDALWSGLPLVTQSGRYFSSRVARSLTLTVGTSEGQVSGLKAYADLVHQLATPPPPHETLAQASKRQRAASDEGTASFGGTLGLDDLLHLS